MQTSQPSSPTTGPGAGTPASPPAVTPCSKPPTCTITSQTIATAPANRARTKIGAGEEVDLTFSLGSATWTPPSSGSLLPYGGGSLSSTSGPKVTYTAPERADSVTISATGSGCTASITFTVVEPSGARRKQKPGTNLKHDVDRPSIGIKTDLYVLPDDVCFYNIEYRELEATAVTSGVYDHAPLKGAGHLPNPNFLPFTKTVEAGLGTKVNSDGDQAFSGDPGTDAPFAPGSVSLDIPYVFRVAGGPEKKFDTVQQIHTLAADGKTLTVSKAGAKGTLQVSAATSEF